MKKIYKYFKLEDITTGVGQPGLTLVAYPAGTTANGTTATALGYGRYLFEIDSTTNDDGAGNGAISKLYDLYVGGVLFQENVDLGLWEWFTSTSNLTTGANTITFASLVDENGDALPTTITNAFIIPVLADTNIGYFYIHDQTTTQFDIVTSADILLVNLLIKITK